MILGYRVPSALSPQSLATSIAADVLGDTPNGRMHQALVASGKAAQVFNYNIDGAGTGFILFRGGGQERRAARAGQAGDDRRGRRQLGENTGIRCRAEAPSAIAAHRLRTRIGGSARIRSGVVEYISLGDWRLFFLQRDQLAKLTAGEVDTAARKYFVRDNRVTGLYVPEDTPLRAEIPAAPSAQQRLADYKPSEKGAVSEAFVPSQDNIDKRTRVLSFGDLNVALLPKQNRGATVTVQTQFKWGNVESLTGRMIESDLAAGMLPRGTDKMTRQQIADEMTRLQMTGGLTGFQTTRENLPDALRLLAQVMRTVSFPATEYDQLQRQVVTGFQAQLDNPEAVSRDCSTRISIRIRWAIRAITSRCAPRSKRSARPRSMLRVVFTTDFYGTARGEIAVVGDFDGKQIEALVNELFTEYKSKAPYARLDREYREVKPARLTVDTPEKENALIRARIDLPLRDDDPGRARADARQ